jgi:hypothetical protein
MATKKNGEKREEERARRGLETVEEMHSELQALALDWVNKVMFKEPKKTPLTSIEPLKSGVALCRYWKKVLLSTLALPVSGLAFSILFLSDSFTRFL